MASTSAMDDLDELPFVIDTTGTPVDVTSAVDRRKSTIFVRNLPFDFTDDQLQRKFESVGPVKRSFIITGKKASQGSRGFGFVIYADENDAQDAIKQLHNTELDGRKIKVELARTPSDATSAAGTPAPRRQQPVRRRQFSKKKPAPGNESVVILEGIDPKASPKFLEKKVRRFGPVSIFDFPAAESTSTCKVARITFASAETARKAVRNLDKKALVVEGSEPIRAGWADGKCARVILRNIPFNCKEPRLKIILKQIGKVKEVHLPKDPEKGDDCNKGFCFVQFEQFADAAKAVAQGSVKLGGRTVAVDWALSKSHYLSHQNDAESDAPSDGENDAASGSESELDVDVADAIEQAEVSDQEGSECSDEDAVEVEENENDSEDDYSQDDSNDDEEGEDDNDDVKPKQERARSSRDVQEQRSVFVRNVPFEASEDAIKQLFSRFGKVKSVMIVMDRDMQRPKGSAFVQFEDATAAWESVKFAASGWSELNNRTDKTRLFKTVSDHGLQLGGRTLDVTLAVDRSHAAKLQDENGRTKKEDKKQAHLVKEGYINAESSAAKGLNKIELAMRSKLYKETTKKLDNPNYIMSKCRLSVHNLPDDIDEKRLRSCFTQAVKEAIPVAKPIVKHCIIVRDKNTLGKDGKPRSLHYGFIEFTEHEHALAALRALNNKPNGLGPKTHRPVIMFAVEDMRKLALRKARLAKSQQKMSLGRLQKRLNVSVPNPAKGGKKRNRDSNQPQSATQRPNKKRSKK